MKQIYTWLVFFTLNFCIGYAVEKNMDNSTKVLEKIEPKPKEAVPINDTNVKPQLNEKKSDKPLEIEKLSTAINPGNVLPNSIPDKYRHIDIEGSARTGFYILMALSVGALLFVGFKIFKMRLTRAERKYGVQGDKTNQELAPLPTTMEDADSDEEDQTIFDINRQQLRIF